MGRKQTLARLGKGGVQILSTSGPESGPASRRKR